MTKKVRNLLRGVGSVIDIVPNTDFREFVPRQSQAERMYGHWVKAGQSIRSAVTQVRDGKKIQK